MNVSVEYRSKVYEGNHVSRDMELKTGHLIAFSAEHTDEFATLHTVGIIEQVDGWLTTVPVSDIRLTHKETES